jgi:hypothetical protein
MKALNLAGQKQTNGRLTAICRTDNRDDGKSLWLCRCECNSIVYDVVGYRFVNGHVRSCGCLKYTPNTAVHLPDGTTIITITRLNGEQYQCFVDTCDYDLVKQHQWAIKTYSEGIVYATTNVPNTTLRMHRLILPTTKQIDHKNHNGLDNRRQNLRPATQAQNSMNARKCSSATTSKYRGVYWHKSRKHFVARIHAKNKYRYLGSFRTEEAAALMYNIFAKLYFGEFANLNQFPVSSAELAA